MTSTAFSTPCWKSAPRRAADRARAPGALAALRRFAGLVACWLLLAAWGPAGAAEITTLRFERNGDGLALTAQVAFDLPPAAEDALQKGIPLSFVAEAVLLRDRWYWYDKEVAQASRYMRLSFQPLTGRWRLAVSATPLGGSGQALGQHFDSRDDALVAMKRIAGWKIADLPDLDPESRYNVTLRFRLDTSQLPRPFQIGVAGQSDWNLAASRNQRLSIESLR